MNHTKRNKNINPDLVVRKLRLLPMIR